MLRTIILLLLAALIFTSPIAIASPFVNLDFEDAVIELNDSEFGFLDWGLAVPGWQHSNSGPDAGTVYYGSRHVGESSLYMLTDAKAHPGETVLEGQFSLLIDPGYIVTDSPPFVNPTGIPSFIYQTGDVPADTNSIQLLSLFGQPRVFMDGMEIPVHAISSNGIGTRYAGVASSFAGKAAELKISFDPGPPQANAYGGFIDDIQFSAAIVPEPSAFALAGIGAIGLIAICRRRVR